jgi:hypothetical protein
MIKLQKRPGKQRYSRIFLTPQSTVLALCAIHCNAKNFITHTERSNEFHMILGITGGYLPEQKQSQWKQLRFRRRNWDYAVNVVT